MGKAKKQKESGNEKFLRDVGNTMINASTMFEPAHQSVLREAKTDQTNLFRGRLAGDTWQQLGTNLGGNNVTAGDTRRQGRYEGVATDAVNTALREGTRRGAELRDERINLGASSRLSNAKQSNVSIQSAARNSFAESAQKAQAANDMNQMLTGAAFTLASAGIGKMMNPGVAEAPPPDASATSQSYANQMATLSGRPQNMNYSPVDPLKKLYGS